MGSHLPVRPFPQPDGRIEYHVSDIEGWDEFESLAAFIVKNFPARVIEKLDGICSRTWTLQVGEIEFTMKHHDDIGNFFFAANATPAQTKLLKAIASALNTQLLRDD